MAIGTLLVAALALVQALVRTASRLVLLGAGQQVETEIRADLFDAFLRLEPGFYQSRRTGDLMSRATNDLQSVSMLVGFGLLSLVNTAIVYAGTLIVMLRMDAWLTLAALAPYPLLVAVARRYNTRAHAEAVAVQEQLAHLATKTQENLSGMAVVRAYTLAPREIEEFGRLNQEHLARVLRQTRTHGLFSPLLAIMTGIGALGVLWVGGPGVLEGRLSLGVLVAFSGYVAYLAWPTMALGWVLAIVRRGLAAFGRVTEILDTRPGILDGPEATPARRPLARRDRDPRADVSLRARPAAGAARREPPRRGGRLRRDRGTDRLGQEHAGRAPAQALGSAARHDLHRRAGDPHDPAAGPPGRDRLRAAGGVPLLADAPRERRVRSAGCRGRRGGRGGQPLARRGAAPGRLGRGGGRDGA